MSPADESSEAEWAEYYTEAKLQGCDLETAAMYASTRVQFARQAKERERARRGPIRLGDTIKNLWRKR